MQKRLFSYFVGVLLFLMMTIVPVSAFEEVITPFSGKSFLEPKLLPPMFPKDAVVFRTHPDVHLVFFSTVGLGTYSHYVAGSGLSLEIYLPDESRKVWISPMYHTGDRLFTVMAGVYFRF